MYRPILHRAVCCAAIVAAVFFLPTLAAAQPSGGGSPWETVVNKLAQSAAGPLARALSLIALVVCGLSVAFLESGAKRTIAGVIFGVALAVGAVNFMAWAFGISGVNP
jgi:type IV secretion system protein VirB2